MNALTVKETAMTTTTSEAFILVAGMTTVPPAGKYAVLFSASVSSTASDADCNLSIFVGNTEQPDSTRKVFGDSDGRAPDLKLTVFTQSVVEMDGNKAVNVRWKTAKGVFKMFARNLLLFPVV